MATLYNVLVSLSPVQDAEVLEGYQRYENLLETILTPSQIEAYADYLQQSREIRILEEMTPEEIEALPAEMAAVVASILSDTNIVMENRRVVALLNQYGEHNITPDYRDTQFVSPSAVSDPRA